MWNKKVKKTNKINSIIGKDTAIDGNIVFTGGLHVDGTVRGNISSAENATDAALSLSESAIIEGDIEVPFVTINGKVTGNITSNQNMEMANNCCITGDVQYSVLQIALGAKINGRLRHLEDQRPEESKENNGSSGDI